MTALLCFCGRLTEEIVDVLAGMGSTLIRSVKARDSWVFAGRAATEHRSLFEKVSEQKIPSLIKHAAARTINGKQIFSVSPLTCQKAVNDEKTNVYEGWPELVEVGGCFPRTLQ